MLFMIKNTPPISRMFRLYCGLLSAAVAVSSLGGAEAPVRHDGMGVCTHFGLRGKYVEVWNPDELIPIIDELGVGWVRDELNWARYEQSRGVYGLPERERAWIDALHARGIKIILVLNTGRGGNPVYSSPFDPEAYAKAAAQLAREVEGKVQAIEILNEPYNFGFLQHHGGKWNGMEADGSDSPWIGAYVRLANLAAVAIKKAVPEMKVIGLGSTAPANFRMIRQGIVPQIDGVVDHPYSFRTVPEILPFAASEGIIKRDGFATADRQGTFASQMELYRQETAALGRRRELWLTEWGFPTYQEAKAGLQYAGYTEEAQAKYSLRRFMEGFSLGIEVSVIYALKNDGTDPHEAENNFGLLDYKNRPKPVYHAVRRLAGYMAPYGADPSAPEVNVFTFNIRTDRWPIEWDGGRLAAPGNVARHAFRDRDGRLMLALWSVERPGDLQPRVADVEIVLEQPVTRVVAHDLFTGERRDVRFERKGARLWLPGVSVPAHPVALEFR